MARYPGAEPVYEVADQFRRRCLIEGGSLLWPEQETWTAANIQALYDAFMGHPDASKRDFLDKWHDQLADQPIDVHRVAADVLAFYQLYPIPKQMSRERKLQNLNRVLSWKLADDQPDLSLVDRAFSAGVGRPGTFYAVSGRRLQIAFFLRFSRCIREGQADPNDVEECQRLADSVARTDRYDVSAARNILLHLLFPDVFERIATDDKKLMIRNAFPSEAAEATNLDDALSRIRSALVSNGTAAPGFDFFDDPAVRRRWDPAFAAEPRSDPAERPRPLAAPAQRDTPRPSTLEQLADDLLLPVDFLQRIERLVTAKRQVIFYGPPGAGKTYVAEKLAKQFAGQGGTVEIVQFHPSYTYEDFVEGYRPKLVNGQPGFGLACGPLKRIAKAAAEKSDAKHVLIIDEINRGNVAKVFGELYFLLEYRDREITLQYSAQRFALPDNLWIIGTMNSTDRSIALIDAALRRRFYFVSFVPDDSPIGGLLARWLARNKPDLLWVADVVDAANAELPNRHATIGPSYFMRPELDEQWVADIWKHAVEPYLEEQFLDDPDRLKEFDLATLRETAMSRTPLAEEVPRERAATADAN